MENRPFPFTPLGMPRIGARVNVARCRGKPDEAQEDRSQETLATTLEKEGSAQ